MLILKLKLLLIQLSYFDNYQSEDDYALSMIGPSASSENFVGKVYDHLGRHMGQTRKLNRRTNTVTLPPINRSPLHDLSSPIDTKWHGSSLHVGQTVMWGTQEPMWPVSKKVPEANEWVKDLAKPKKNFQKANVVRPLYYYSAGRPTTIWEMNPAAQNGTSSPRLDELASPKPVHKGLGTERASYMYSCGRPSMISLTPSPAGGSCSPRLKELARPKRLHTNFVENRQIVQPLNISSKLKR